MTGERFLTDEETKKAVLELRRLFRRAKAENTPWEEKSIKVSVTWTSEEIVITFFEPNSDTLWFDTGFVRATTIFRDVRNRCEDMLNHHYVEKMTKHKTHLSETDVSTAKEIIDNFLECYRNECDEAITKKYIE